MKNANEPLDSSVEQAKWLLNQQRQMLEAGIYDLNRKRDRERLGRLKIEAEKIRQSLEKARDKEKRARERQKELDRENQRHS